MNHGGAALKLTAKMSGTGVGWGVQQRHPQMDIPQCQPNWLPSQVWRLHSDGLDTRVLLKLYCVACVCVLYPIPWIYESVPVQASWHFVMTPLGTDHCLKLCLRAARTHICTNVEGRSSQDSTWAASQTPQSGSSSLFSTPNPDPSLGTECFPLILESPASLPYSPEPPPRFAVRTPLSNVSPNARPTFPNFISRKKGRYPSMAWIAQWVDHLCGLHVLCSPHRTQTHHCSPHPCLRDTTLNF